jgi:hypothetical protein
MAIRTVYEPEEPDPFRDFTFTEMLAFIHKSQFASGLQAFFSEFDSDYGQQLKREYKIDLWREVLTDAADELSRLGLKKVAAICLEEGSVLASEHGSPAAAVGGQASQPQERLPYRCKGIAGTVFVVFE